MHYIYYNYQLTLQLMKNKKLNYCMHIQVNEVINLSINIDGLAMKD